MRANQPSLQSVLRIVLLVVMAASPALARFGQEKGPPIIADDMEGRRLPNPYIDCPWYTGSAVIGYGEKGEFRIPFVRDPDIFYDPYTVYDQIWCRWRIYDPTGQLVFSYDTWADAYPQIPGAGVSYIDYLPQKRGSYTIVCTMDDGRSDGDPARDDPVVKQMTMDVQCQFTINQIFSTDGANTDPGSPKAGLVGVDVTWTAGYPPRLIASHRCDYLYAPQIPWEGSWRTLSEERPPDFPHRGKYYFDSTTFFVSDFYHNSDDESFWTLAAGPSLYFQPTDWEETKDEQTFELHNLSVEDAGAEYLIYDPETGSGNTITYKLKDAYQVCPQAQETTVNLTIYSSDGTFGRTDSFTKTAGPEATYTYVWDGKDFEGNQAPKGIYTYSITAYQLAQIPNPAVPGSYFTHQEWDADKSLWSLTTTDAEIIACDEETGASTVRMGFLVDPGGMPEGANWKIDHAKVEVFDPDLNQIASAQVGESPVDQTVYFPDLNITFDKGGTYVFLVSAWDRLYRDKLPMNRTHKSKPLLQQNQRIVIPGCVVVIDPGHGGANVGAHGSWAFENHNDHDQDQNLLQSESLEYALTDHRSFLLTHSNPSQRYIRYGPITLTRRSNVTVKFKTRVDIAAGADRTRVQQGLGHILFIAEHNNIAGTSNNQSLVMLPPGGTYEGNGLPYQPPPGTLTLQNMILDELADTPIPPAPPARPSSRSYEPSLTEVNMGMLMMLWTDNRTRHIPGVLIEQVNLQTRTDEDLLLTGDFRADFAIQTHRDSGCNVKPLF